VTHCTLVPRRGRTSLALVGGSLRASLRYTIAGRVVALVTPVTNARVPALHASSSIVDGGVDLLGGTADLDRVTVLGGVVAETVLADTCIVTEPLVAPAGRDGQVRYTSLARGSRVVGPFECPRRARPSFTSTRYGDPGYGQLTLGCPREIAAGGEGGDELGAFNWLEQPDRMARLPIVLHELLPVDVAASVTFGT
ncbi:MAG: hypothetical protein M3389_10310, partial [Actinomycetota bacterium]|nr:hypothetical protein [Actinomycetota bacterium]